MMEAVLVAHVAATLYMTGLIWFVQAVHYPLFALIGGEGSSAYALAHQRRTSWVVGPPMLVELLTATILLAVTPSILTGIGAALIAIIWISTAFAMVPCHRRLLRGHDAAVVTRLVRGNWVRTGAWTLRAGLALWLLGSAAMQA